MGRLQDRHGVERVALGPGRRPGKVEPVLNLEMKMWPGEGIARVDLNRIAVDDVLTLLDPGANLDSGRRGAVEVEVAQRPQVARGPDLDRDHALLYPLDIARPSCPDLGSTPHADIDSVMYAGDKGLGYPVVVKIPDCRAHG